MGRGRPRYRGRPLGPAAAPRAAAPVLRGQRLPDPLWLEPPIVGERRGTSRGPYFSQRLEALVAELERGALPVDLLEHVSAVVERGARLDRVDALPSTVRRASPRCRRRRELHVVAADQDLVPRQVSRHRLRRRRLPRRGRGVVVVVDGRWSAVVVVAEAVDVVVRRGRRRRRGSSVVPGPVAGGADAAARGQLEAGR